MSKMSDMAMTIEELRNAAAAINDVANWLAQQFGGASEATEKAEAPAAPAKTALTLRKFELFWLINLVPGIQLKFESFLKSTVQASCHS